MTTLGLRECDKLEGASNNTHWNWKLQMLSEEVEIWLHVAKEIIAPTYMKLLLGHIMKESKA